MDKKFRKRIAVIGSIIVFLSLFLSKVFILGVSSPSEGILSFFASIIVAGIVYAFLDYNFVNKTQTPHKL